MEYREHQRGFVLTDAFGYVFVATIESLTAGGGAHVPMQSIVKRVLRPERHEGVSSPQ